MGGAAEIENNDQWNFKNLRGMSRNTNSSKRNERARQEISYCSLKAPSFFSILPIFWCRFFTVCPRGKSASDTNLAARMAGRPS